MKSNKSQKDEVYRAIGKNILSLQKMEGMLKALVMCANLSVPHDEPRKAVAKRKKAISKTSMGRLAGEFIESVRPSARQSESESEGAQALMFSMNVTFENELFVNKLEKSLRTIVEERNNLIHKQLLNFDVESSETCLALLDELKAQEKRIEPQIKDLARILSALQEARADILEYVTSGTLSADAARSGPESLKK